MGKITTMTVYLPVNAKTPFSVVEWENNMKAIQVEKKEDMVCMSRKSLEEIISNAIFHGMSLESYQHSKDGFDKPPVGGSTYINNLFEG